MIPSITKTHHSIPSNSEIEDKLPNELLGKIFSFLPNRELISAYCVSTRWGTATLDPVRRQEANRFKSFIQLIANNITEEKNKKTKDKVENLLTEVKLSEDVIINLCLLKDTLLSANQKLIALLQELPIEKQRYLKELLEYEEKPLHFHKTFDFVPILDDIDIAILFPDIIPLDRIPGGYPGGFHNLNPAMQIANQIQLRPADNAIAEIANIIFRLQGLNPAIQIANRIFQEQ